VATGEWTVTTAPYYDAGCTLTARLIVESISLPADGSIYIEADCPAYGVACSMTYDGSVD
jgi:hypothetical protein